jgi:hypothetical protein
MVQQDTFIRVYLAIIIKEPPAALDCAADGIE